MPKSELKLFVWVGFNPDYLGGLAFAIAKDETEARKMIIKDNGYNPSDWGELKVHSLKRKLAYCVSGGG